MDEKTKILQDFKKKIEDHQEDSDSNMILDSISFLDLLESSDEDIFKRDYK